MTGLDSRVCIARLVSRVCPGEGGGGGGGSTYSAVHEQSRETTICGGPSMV